MLKIISWNVNGLRAVERKKALQECEKKLQPDLLLLQEIKGDVSQFSSYLTNHPDYYQYYNSAQKKGYAGTGIWIRRNFLNQCKAVNFITDVPHLPASDEGRIAHIMFMHKNIAYSILSIYFPNGGKSEKAWQDKLVFYDKVLDYMNVLRLQKRIVIVGGDMNVAHMEQDIARPQENDGKIGFHPDERKWIDQVVAQDWVDVWRYQHPNIHNGYTWWSHWGQARQRNVGWRIDYFFIDNKYISLIKESHIFSNIIGSDHCPVGVLIEI